ncbi:GNAT family N-acetyltransferase [Halobacterium zhouii]|uniref:GNAT family N-acetyltransferase n=1 Tax=Halobacterium zhouii TaxID=2902624 RepID=UPI001E576BE4|nr:GNAT family N-acetyltransferase [Halobacterium zhouii]
MVRPYRESDADELWKLKRGFETGLGAGTGSDEKQAAYEAKLNETYRERWLDWVERCVAENERCVQVAETRSTSGAEDASRNSELAGYVFVLPESMAFVWDAAVLNEVFVRPDWRGTGAADDLMAAALAVAREQDLPLDRMVLDVDGENERARAFYERHDFSHWGEMVARDL